MSETANAHAPVPLIPITGEALLYNQFYSSRKTVSTGIPKLDVLIGGGLLASEVIEFYGKSNSGKTQLCHKIISAVACRDEDDASALYLDLHCDFSIERLDKDALQGPALNNIRVMRHFGVTGLLRCLEFLEKELPLMQTPFYRKLRLVVIDSIPFALYCLSMEWPNPDRATEEKIAMTLKRLASNHKLTILVINHSINIRSDISTINRNFSKKTKPALGKYWLHIPNIRIHVCRENENEVALLEEDNFKDVPCRATLEKSGHGQPQRFFNFVLSKGGDIII